jgi:hypothetical protein
MGALENDRGQPVGTGHDVIRATEDDPECWVYPNPVSGVTSFFYTLTQSSSVHLAVYSLRGQLVESVVAEFQPAGHYRVEWDGSAQGPGPYIYKLVTGKENPKTGKLLILR